MRIMVVYTNRNRMLCPAPIGALLVAHRLRQAGHQVTFVDLMHEKEPAKRLAAALAETSPELVCFSIRNVDNQMMAELDRPLDEIVPLATLVKQHTKAPLLLGGTAVTTFPVQIRALLGADYAYAGDDVEPIVQFVNSLRHGAPDLTVPGLVYENAGGVHRNPYTIRGYHGMKWGGHEWVSLKAYRKGYYDCGVVTHSGCPHGCSFCDAHRSFGRDYVLREVRQVVAEIAELKSRHKARSLWLVNSGVNRPLDYGKELMARLIEAKLGLFFGCIIEPGEFDAEMARLMYRAGCSAPMLFGSTLADSVLERNQPHYRSADVVNAARLLHEAKMGCMLGLMFGAPGETLDTVQHTLELAREIKPIMTITGVGFRVQPETPLRQIAVDQGVIAADDDCFQAKFYVSPDSPVEGIRERIAAHRRADRGAQWRMAKFVLGSVRESIFGRRA